MIYAKRKIYSRTKNGFLLNKFTQWSEPKRFPTHSCCAVVNLQETKKLLIDQKG